MSALADLRDRFFGRGRYSITVPPLDGALRPNTALDEAPTLSEAQAPGHLQAVGEALWFASGPSVCRLQAGRVTVVETHAAPVTALAIAADGSPATARLDGQHSLPFTPRDLPEGDLRRCVTGLAFDRSGGIFMTIGSLRNAADDWAKDLLEQGATGSLWHLSASGEARQVAGGLAWPEAPLVTGDGAVLLAESSASRLLRFDARGGRTVPIAHLPGYPAGICEMPQGYALCLKAPRNQLIEFILREGEFAAEMVAKVPRDYWLAPSLHPQSSFLEPLQGGALKQLGQMKPWAPSRSYGLVIELDPAFVPRRSHHSRADGRCHGTVACARYGGGLVVASVGAGRLLQLGTAEGGAA